MERSPLTPPPALAFAAHARPGAAAAPYHDTDSLSAPSTGLAASGGVSQRQQQSQEQSQAVGDVLEDEHGAPAVGAALTGGKRKRVVLSVQEKQQVLTRLEAGEPPAAIARAFGISRQQVSDIKKNRARILAFCVDAKHLSSLQRKTLRVTSEFHPGVEQELYRWIVRQRSLQRAITADALAAKAAALFQQYAAAATAGAGDAVQTHSPLKNVGVWLRHFKRTHGIKALSDDEIQQLPDSFSPAMDMALTATPGPDQGGMYTAGAASLGSSMTSSTAASGQPHNALAFGLAHSTAALNIDDVSTFMAASAGAYHPLPQLLTATELLARPGAPSRAEGAAPGLISVVEAVQHLNVQVGVFERTMALKLDDLDARVEKLCFAVLPARFT